VNSLPIESRKLGLLLLFLGLALLLISFGIAYMAYSTVEGVVIQSGDIVDAFTYLITVIAEMLPRLLWVAVMVAVGGILMSKGIVLMKMEGEVYSPMGTEE